MAPLQLEQASEAMLLRPFLWLLDLLSWVGVPFYLWIEFVPPSHVSLLAHASQPMRFVPPQ